MNRNDWKMKQLKKNNLIPRINDFLMDDIIDDYSSLPTVTSSLKKKQSRNTNP